MSVACLYRQAAPRGKPLTPPAPFANPYDMAAASPPPRTPRVQVTRRLRGRHLVLKSRHPSPLSAHSGWFGSRPFSQANAFLEAQGRGSIDWAIPPLDTQTEPSALPSD